MFLVKVVTPPRENGFANDFVEWFKSDTGGQIHLTREPAAAERFPGKGDAELTAAWVIDEMPDRVVTIELED